jgi:hypothetical protein
MTEKFDLETALNKGMEATGLAKDTFKDKFTAKLKVLQDGKAFNHRRSCDQPGWCLREGRV